MVVTVDPGPSSSVTETSKVAAATAAGAVNWILKDGIGQLGGVLGASYFGTYKQFDTNPKRYRMYAAIILDVATLLELSTYCSLTILGTSILVVPLACLATVCKNFGFIMAGASRATLHQSLCHIKKSTNCVILSDGTSATTTGNISNNNLADVTAKFGSQSTAAGLAGTALGITLSSLIIPTISMHHPDIAYFYSIITFLVLALVHQTCTYKALRSVSLYDFNRHRLCILLNHFVQDQNLFSSDEVCISNHSKNDIRIMNVLTPGQVAEREHFLPTIFFVTRTDSYVNWLVIGCDLPSICPKGPAQLFELVKVCSNESYILNIESGCARFGNNKTGSSRIQLVFFEQATGSDIVRGMLHAHLVRNELMRKRDPSIYNPGLADETTILQVIGRSHAWIRLHYASFLQHLHAVGWDTTTAFVEDESSAVRFAVNLANSFDCKYK
jgi:Vitamin B6 photo-protection and homoeostasis